MLLKLIYTFCKKPKRIYQEMSVGNIIHSMESITAGDFSVVNFGEATEEKASLKRILYYYKGVGFACVEVQEGKILLYDEKWRRIIEASFPLYKIVY